MPQDTYILCLILFLANLVVDIDDLSDVSYDFGIDEEWTISTTS